MHTRSMSQSFLPLILGASCLAACGGELGDSASSNPQVTNVAQAVRSAGKRAIEFLPPGGSRAARTAAPRSASSLDSFDYPATSVGRAGNVTVYYDPDLGTKAKTLAKKVLAAVAGPYNDMQTIFGITGGPVQVVIAPLSGNNDGSGGAYHYGCDFTSGGVLYVDATFDNTTVDPVRWEIGLYVAELSEAFMGAQGAGWDCGGSNGEGLSRYLAEVEMAPAKIPSWGITGPSWADAGFPDWISNTEGTDTDYQSIGAATVYINWMVHQGYSNQQITQAGGAALEQNYETLTGGSDAYDALTAALSGITVTTDNPWAM